MESSKRLDVVDRLVHPIRSLLPDMTIDAIEAHFGTPFPERHRRAFLDPEEPIHEACDFLLPSSPYSGLQLVGINEFLHHAHPDPWPVFLLAFASNGCGDYFAYDLRSSPPIIVYIDPDHTVAENLASGDMLWYPGFASWYAAKIQRRQA